MIPLQAALPRHVGRQSTTKFGFEALTGVWLRSPLKDIVAQYKWDAKQSQVSLSISGHYATCFNSTSQVSLIMLEAYGHS
jgi:hypothetical protein